MIAAGDQCRTPFECPFFDYCAPPRTLSDAAPSGTAVVDPAAGRFLMGLGYPRYYLDFESINPAVPVWPGTRPYQQQPFQWSCHVEEQPGELRHESFLDLTGNIPFRPLAEKLLSTLKETGPIFCYANFEKQMLNKLAACLPDLAGDLAGVKERLVDLLPITRKSYSHPALRGSCSLKAVLPTIAPDLSYDCLTEVADGMDAGRAYLEMVRPGVDNVRRKELRDALDVYCRQDTLGLVKLVEFFQEHR